MTQKCHHEQQLDGAIQKKLTRNVTKILLVDDDPIPYYAEPIRLFISSTISFIGSSIFKNKSKVSNKDNLK